MIALNDRSRFGTLGLVDNIIPPVLCLVGWISTALVLSTSSILFQVSTSLRIVCALVFTGFLLRSALISTDRGIAPQSWYERWLLRAQRSVYYVLPLVLLPITEPALGASASIGKLALVATTIFLFLAMRGGRKVNKVRNLRDALSDPFDLALAAMTLVLGVQYLSIAYQTEGLGSIDAAYYFGMARRVVAGKSFSEPLVWHYLAPPNQIVHPSFDYWSPMLSLVLAPVMYIFGSTERVANMTVAFVSFVSVALMWYVVCVPVRLKHGASRFIALVIFAYLPALGHLRFCPDTVPLAQVFALIIVIALVKQRVVLAVVSAFLLFMTRGDTAFVVIAAWGIAIWLAWKTKKMRVILVTSATIGMLYVLRNLLTFSTITPPGASLAPFLERYQDLYAYRTGHQSVVSLSEWLSPSHFVESGKELVYMLRTHVEFFPNVITWCLLASIALFAGRRLRRRQAFVLAVVLAFGIYSTHFIAGKVFSPIRTLHVYDPLLILVGALGFDAVLGFANCSLARFVIKATFLRAVFTALVMMGLPWIWLSQLSPYGHRVRDYAQLGHELKTLDRTLAGAHVASDRPWFFLAYTNSPAIMLPENGSEAIEAAILRYNISWVVIDEEDPEWMTASRQVVRDLVNGHKTQVGRVQMNKVAVDGSLHVFRVKILENASDNERMLSRRNDAMELKEYY